MSAREGIFKAKIVAILLFTLVVSFYSATSFSSDPTIVDSPMGLLLQILNLAFSAGILMYAIKVEHRFTKLETQMDMVLKKSNLACFGIHDTKVSRRQNEFQSP